MLSDREVLDILRINKSKTNPTNLATIIYETISYLEASPAATCSVGDLGEFLDVIKERGYNLTSIEKVQIANLKPQNEMELQLIVDNLEEKFTEEQRADLLQLISSLNKETSTKKLKQ